MLFNLLTLPGKQVPSPLGDAEIVVRGHVSMGHWSRIGCEETEFIPALRRCLAHNPSLCPRIFVLDLSPSNSDLMFFPVVTALLPDSSYIS